MSVKLNTEFLDEHGIKAVIFDMDGLLIDSEPLWQRAEIEIFTSVGVPLTHKLAMETIGSRVDDVVSHWFDRYPWQKVSKKEVEELIVNKLIFLVEEEGEPLPGAIRTLEFFKELGLPAVIASSSTEKIIKSVVNRLKIEKYLAGINSAEHEEYGKPHPAVFISAAKRLREHPRNCLVFEDSIAGMIAAKAAKMKCFAIPNPEAAKDARSSIADFRAESLEDLH